MISRCVHVSWPAWPVHEKGDSSMRLSPNGNWELIRAPSCYTTTLSTRYFRKYIRTTRACSVRGRVPQMKWLKSPEGDRIQHPNSIDQNSRIQNQNKLSTPHPYYEPPADSVVCCTGGAGCPGGAVAVTGFAVCCFLNQRCRT
jgi:hypothetical protein